MHIRDMMDISSLPSLRSRSYSSKTPWTVSTFLGSSPVRLLPPSLLTHSLPSSSPCPLLVTQLITAIVLLDRVSPTGSVSGDKFGESDTRFTYILLSSLSLLDHLDDLDEIYEGKGRELVLENLRGSGNFDGGFGPEPGGESHGAQGEWSPRSVSRTSSSWD